MDEIYRYQLQKLLKSLSNSKGNGTSMITLIIPPGSQISQIASMLTTEYGTASNIKSHVNKLSVQAGIRSAQEKLKLYNRVPKNGLVICVGTIDEGKKVSYDFEPFKPVCNFLYRCDNKFHLEALENLFKEEETFGFIIVGGSSAVFATLTGSHKKIVEKFTVELPNKHRRGGQSSVRFARIRIEKRHNYLRKVAETATSVFISKDMPNVSGLVIAGKSLFKKQLVEDDLFDKRLKEIVLKVLDVQYEEEAGLNQAILMAAETLKGTKYVKEQRILSKFYDELARDTGMICYGTNDTMYALENGVVDKLIVWEKLGLYRKVEGEEIRYEKEGTEEEFLVDFLIEKVKEYKTEICFVSDDTTEGSQFVHGFGGLGAFLRQSIEMPVDEDGEELDSDEEFI